MGNWCLPSVNALNDQLEEDFKTFIGTAGAAYLLVLIKNVVDCYELFIIGIVSCIILVFFYNLMLKFFPRLLTWLSFVLVVSWIAVIGYFLWYYATSHYNKNEASYYVIQAVAYILWIFVFFFMVTICCLWKNIKVSVQVLRCVAKVIHTNYHIVLVPLLAIALASGWVIATCYFLIYLATCGTTQQAEFLGLPYVVYKFTDTQMVVFIVGIIYFFIMLWLLMTICDYLLIVSVTEWYFHQAEDGNLHILRGFWWTFRYNFGSLVLGSLLVTWIWIFRAAGNYV